MTKTGLATLPVNKCPWAWCLRLGFFQRVFKDCRCTPLQLLDVSKVNIQQSAGTDLSLSGRISTMPSSDHDFLILEVEYTRHVALATGIAWMGTVGARAPDLLPATSLTTTPGVINKPAYYNTTFLFEYRHLRVRRPFHHPPSWACRLGRWVSGSLV